MAQVSYGTITITDTNDIESIVIEYARNQSSSSAPESGWSTTRPAWAQGYYIWQRTRTHKAGTETSEDTYGTAVCITGSTGATGAAGRSLSSTVTHYTIATSSATINQSNMGSYTWTTNVPSYNASYPTYWVRVTNTYSNPSSTEYIFYKDQGITDAIKTSNDANTTAGQAKTTADAAKTKVDNLETTYNTFIDTKAKYFVHNSNGSIVIASREEESSPVAFDEDTVSTYGYNALTAPSYISLRYNATDLAKLSTGALIFYKPNTTNKGMELTSTALTFYNPSTNTAQLIIGANGALQSGNYSRGSDSKFSSNGTKIDLINGDIITKYFRLSQGLESLNAGAYIHGTIEALDGSIGSDTTNYWEIGNGTDYNLNSTAKMIGHGSSYIQLGDSSTWRLATNRIHTGWYVSNDSLLHFPAISSKYWDFGIHSPNSATDKFLYIRSSKANTSASNILQNLLYDIDDSYATSQWDYKFYIDGSGNLYANNLYFFDENGNPVQVGGADGAYLPKTGGTITGNLEVNGTLTKGGKNVAYLTATPTNGQILVADGTTGGIKTSGYTIATSVPQNAVFTDKNVQTTKANTTKIYLTGTQTNGTNTGTLNFDEYVYVDTTAGALHATTFNGYTLAAAAAKGVDTSMTSTSTSTNLPTTKAVADLIATYLPLAGGTVSGAVDINDELYADGATFGNLIVNGVGRFTNGIYGDLIGNVTGNITGNAATADKVNHNLIIKLASGTTEGTNMFTFNGSTTKTVDITKSALGLENVENKSSATIRGELTSANVTTALGFTPYNSTNPNGYTTNTGTVTSVAASGSGGITISGSPITTNGTITVGLNLSTAINGLGEGTSNANREDYVVVQYAGGGTTTTTYHRRKLKLLFAALNSSDITTALGYTPYDSTNPNGYTSNIGTITGVTAGTGLSGGGTSGTVTLNHSNSVTAQTTQGIYPIKIDAQGHISAYGSAPTTLSGYGITDAKIANGIITLGSNTITPLTSQWTANLYVGKTATDKANAAATNGNVYLNLVENNTVRNAHKITGSGTTTVTSDADGNITISSADSKVGTVTSITLTQGTGISIENSGTAITTSGSRTIGLADNYGDTKNPYASKTARYVLAAPANAAGMPSFRALTGADVGLGNVLNTTQVTGIGQGADGKIRVYKGDSNYEDVAVEIVATESSSVASAQKLSSYGGSTKQPVYFPSTGTNAGKPVAISYTIETSVPSGAVFTDTTYTFTSGTNGFTVTPLNGTAQTVTVTPSITNNITGSGTSGYLAKFNGANTITSGPALGTDTTKFLNNKGEWSVPSGAVTGVKGNSESAYRTGQVNITKANIGLGNVDNTADANKNVLTATKFSSNRTVALTGDVTGSASGDGSNGWSIATTVQDDSHNHTLDTILPLKSKTFTDVIASANNWANGVFFFGSIKPTTWNTTWRIKYKINVYVPNHPNYCQMAIVTVSGRQGSLASYASFNTIGEYYVCYYHELYRLKADGFTNGYGHSLGVRFQSAYVPTDTDYKRTIEIDLLETKNCSFDFYDSCLKYAEIPGTGTTNYNTYSEMDFVTNGLQETGDANDVNYYNRSYYGSRTTKNALYRYQFCVTESSGQLIPINSVNNSVATNKTLMTDAFDPFGEIFFWGSTSTYSAGANVGNGYWYRQYLADLRYSFNCGGYDTDSTLTARLPLYLVATPQTDGTAKLYSQPLSQTLPSSDNGLIYIYLGRVYEDTKPYRVVLTFNHPIYWYKDGAVRQYTHMAQRALTATKATQDGDGNTISSTYLKLSGGTLTGDLGIRMGDTDRHIIFDYDGDGTAGASWRIAALGSGSSDTNYFAIQSGTSTTSATDWNNVIRLGQNTYDAAFGGNIYPLANNNKTLGTSSLKWSNVYATTFTGNLTGNVTGTASGNITSVQYDSTNTKFTYTKNGSNTDIVTIANLKTYLGLAAAAYKAVVTSIDTSASLPTSNAVKTFVEGKGYVTSSGVTSVATSSPITGGTITGTGTIGHATSGVGTATTTAGLYKFKYDTYGHVTGVVAITKADITGLGIPGSDTDTKNTAGSTDINDALFLIGATTQAANPQTYSHNTVKINSTGQLISTGYEMTTSDSMNNAKCQMKYDAAREAIVFSFS